MRRNFCLVIWFVALACTSSGCRPGQPPAADPVVANSQPDQPAMPAVDPSAADLEALQGWWEVVDDWDPDAAPGAPQGGWGRGTKLLIEGSRRYLFTSYDTQVYNSCICIRLDAAKTPKHLDEWPMSEMGKEFTRAIYKIEQGNLMVVYGTTGPDVRPIKFDDRTKRTLKYRRCPVPKWVKLNGDPEYRPKLDTKHAPAEIVR